MNESSIQLISNIEEKMIEIECDERKMRGVFLYVIKKCSGGDGARWHIRVTVRK